MNFSGKITQLLIGISLSLVSGAVIVRAEPKISQATPIEIAQDLTPEEINLRAKQTIVRIDGASVGSGSIVDYADGVYTVLTNWHVMKNQGQYIVQTIDGRQHQVDSNSIQQLSGLDLAIFKFSSRQNYQIAETGDSANLNEGQSVYFAGYPGELRREDNRYYRFFTVNLVGILPKSTEKGYSLVYSGEAFPGMSGGPVLNQQGLVIGVHGEANIHALSGGTSNYAIPINSYKSAIAKLNTPAQPPANNAPEVVANPPEKDNTTAESETSSPTQAENQPETPEQATEPPEVIIPDSGEVSSVPTFTSEPNSQPDNESAREQVETADQAESKESVEPETSTSNTSEPNREAAESKNTASRQPQKPTLISSKTGIDYRKLRDLLQAKKWSEADLHTYKLVEQIVKTAKQQNKNIFIELKTIANFSCPDIRTIDNLWQEYSGNKFGFSSQQEIWQTVNQKGDFSTQTWRKFATKVGWKKGEVINGTGYLLYDELDFDPNVAPSGHLPWWFALPDEEQKVIKQLFARCNFNPTPEELAAEAAAGKSQNSPKNDTRGDERQNEPNINKPPK